MRHDIFPHEGGYLKRLMKENLMVELINGQGSPMFKVGDRVVVNPDCSKLTAIIGKFGTKRGRVVECSCGHYTMEMGDAPSPRNRQWVLKQGVAEYVFTRDHSKKGHITYKFT